MNTDLTVEITDLAWTITKAELAGDYLHDDEESDPLSRDQLWLSNMAFHGDFTLGTMLPSWKHTERRYILNI